MNIVQIEHKGYPVRYTFEVPYGVKLKKGDIVQVKDKRGYHIVECVTDSHEVDDELLDMIMNGKKVTASVTGVYNLAEFGEETCRESDLAERVLEAIDKSEERLEAVFHDPIIGKGSKFGFNRCKSAVFHVLKGGNDGK